MPAWFELEPWPGAEAEFGLVVAVEADFGFAAWLDAEICELAGLVADVCVPSLGCIELSEFREDSLRSEPSEERGLSLSVLSCLERLALLLISQSLPKLENVRCRAQ